MKKLLILSTTLLTLAIQSGSAQNILLYSFENSSEGWGPIEANWTSGGFSTTTGVTDGIYSWMLTAAANPDYGAALGGPSSATLTTQLMNAQSVSFDVNVPGGGQGTFGFFLQFDLTVNQPGGIGYQSVDGYTYSQFANIGGQKTLTFAIPVSIRTGLAANPGLPTSLNLQIGGGGSGNMYLDNMIATVPEPGTMGLLGVGALGLAWVRRRSR
jgi:hypothetical protein